MPFSWPNGDMTIGRLGMTYKWYRFSRAPFTTLGKTCPCRVFSQTYPFELRSSMMYGPIHDVSNLWGFPLILLSYNSTKSLIEMSFVLIFLSCQAFCCCFYASWCCIAIILSSSNFWSWNVLSFLASLMSILRTSAISNVCFLKCNGTIASCP